MLVPIISRPTTTTEMEEIAEKTAIELRIFRILGEEPLPGEWIAKRIGTTVLFQTFFAVFIINLSLIRIG